MSQKLSRYASYNTLARKPLVMGVPIKVLVVLLTGALLSAILGYHYFEDLRALVVPVLLLLVLAGIHIACTDDSRAMSYIAWDLKGLQGRLQCASNIVSYSSMEDLKSKRKQNVKEFFKNNSHL